MSKDTKIPTIKPLENVYWYPYGDTNAEGCPAICRANDGRGGLKLCIFLIDQSKPQWLNGVRNVNDPLLEERPALKKNSGAWESAAQYAARQEARQLEMMEQQERDRQSREAEVARRQAETARLKQAAKEAVKA